MRSWILNYSPKLQCQKPTIITGRRINQNLLLTKTINAENNYSLNKWQLPEVSEELKSSFKEDIKDEKTDDEENTPGVFNSSQHHNLSRILSINPLADSKDSSSIITTNCVQKTEDLEDGTVSLCVCGEPSTKGISGDDTQQLQVT